MKAYDYTFKREALLKLRDNDFNWTKTARMMSINVMTLRNWHGIIGEEIYASDTNSDELMRKQAELSLHANEQVRKKASNLLEAIIDRIQKDIDNKRKKIQFRDLVSALKEISPYILPKFVLNKDGDGERPDYEKELAILVWSMYQKNNNNETIGHTGLEIHSKESAKRKQ